MDSSAAGARRDPLTKFNFLVLSLRWAVCALHQRVTRTDIIMDCNISSYADGTKFGRYVTCDSDLNIMQQNIDKISEWCEEHKMRLNSSKCVVMHFGRINPNFNYFMGGNLLSKVSQHEDLGVIVDNKLSFSSQILKVRNKANGVMHFIKNCVTTRNSETMRKLYISLVRPILDYCAPFWSPYLIRDIELIEQVQRRYTKLVQGCNALSYRDRLEYLDLFSLEFRRKRGGNPRNI